MKITCILVDDERLLRESLGRFIKQYCPELELIGKAANAEEACRLLAENQVDVIFCDIRMPGQSGIDFLGGLEAGRYHVVFVTAYNEYALHAIKARAFDYLLKPIDIDELKSTVISLVASIRKKQESEEIKKLYSDAFQKLLSEVVPSTARNERVSVHHSGGILFLESEDIFYLEGDGNYTVVHQQSGKKILATRTLSDFEKSLSPHLFFRIHKSFIVNVKQVSEYVRVDGFFLVLKNGQQLPISRRRVQAVLDMFRC